MREPPRRSSRETGWRRMKKQQQRRKQKNQNRMQIRKQKLEKERKGNEELTVKKSTFFIHNHKHLPASLADGVLVS